MSGWRTLGVAWILLFVLSAAWSMATPIAAAPDEPAHLIKAASVARGQFIGESASGGQIVQVPRYIAHTHAQTCFAFQPDTTAACSERVEGDPWTSVDAQTTAGLYNPVYYLLVGWPTLIAHDASGIYLVRLASAAVSSLFLALAFSLIARWRRPGLALLGLATAVTPMVLFLGGTVNPSSLETTAILTVGVGMLSIVLHPRDDLLPARTIVVIVAAAVALNTRGLSPAWVALAVFAPLILARGPQLTALLRTTVVRTAIILVAAATAFALVWLVGSNSLAAGIAPPSEIVETPSTGPAAGFLSVLERTFGLGQNMIGVFGWLDTPAPLAVFFIWSVFVGALALVAFVVLRGRQLLLAVALTVSVLVVPAVIQAFYITGGGFIWQGRYTLPAFVCLVVALAALLGDRLEDAVASYLPRLAAIVLGLWATAQAYAFLTVLRRYAIGAEGTWAELVRSPEWVPPGGLYLWSGLFAAALVVTVFAIQRIASGSGTRRESPALTPVLRSQP